jgi:GrpB-like predicted nucleotidyltransferase (UPF0157 family)
MIRKIEVVPYDAGWPHAFQAEANRLAALWGDEVVAIHHIGSTSIPGMSAKPIIDVLVEVRAIDRMDRFDEMMRQSGYLPRGENGIPGRRYFIRGDEIHRTHHIHVFETGHPDIQRHLDLRDYLRTHPEDADAYCRLKLELAARFPMDIDSYVAGKDGLIKELDRKARDWQDERKRSDG